MLKKLRDITAEEWKKFQEDGCANMLGCNDCIFNYANCSNSNSDYAWIYHKDMYSDKFLNQEIEIEMPHKTIPRGTIPNQLKWIARDMDGTIGLFEEKPFKNGDFWDYQNGNSEAINRFCEEMLGNPFTNVQWEDTEPTMIEE